MGPDWNLQKNWIHIRIWPFFRGGAGFDLKDKKNKFSIAAREISLTRLILRNLKGEYVMQNLYRFHKEL